MPQLQVLSLCDNGIRGGLVALSERGLLNLRDLNLSGNAVEDFNELRALSPLRKLRRLDLRRNIVCNTPDYARLARALVPSLQFLNVISPFAPQAGTLVVSEVSWNVFSKNGVEEGEDDRDAEDDVVIMLEEEDPESAPKRARIGNVEVLEMDEDDSDDDSDFSTAHSSEEEGEDEEDEEEEEEADGGSKRERLSDEFDGLLPGDEGHPEVLMDPLSTLSSQKDNSGNDAAAPARIVSALLLHPFTKRSWKRLHTNYQGESDVSN